MPSQTDHSDSPSSSNQSRTLPALEVNPLVNPLLAENMGRWAEVYFKSPPENREQAVRELLQELEAENAQRGNDSGSPRWTNEQGFTQDEASRSEAFVPSLENRAPEDPALEDRRAETEYSPMEHSLAEPSPLESFLAEHALQNPFEKIRTPENHSAPLHCRSCGHDNRADQRFCGMCGLPLQRDIASEPVAEETERAREKKVSERNERVEREFRLGIEEGFRPEDTEREVPARTGLWSGRKINIDQDESVSAGLIRSLDYGADTRSYRGYVAAVVIVIVLALGYVGWRSSYWNKSKEASEAGTSSPATQQFPPPSFAQGPAPGTQQVETVEPNSNSNSNAKGTDTRVATESRPAAKPSVEKVNAAGTATKPSVTPASETPAPVTPASAVDTQMSGTGGSGYEELAMAKRYLNGSAGQQNRSEAVQWLWRAVSKRNTDATLLLSDMFMRGDGIPKNCDQARVLLDAAASRGVKDAALRLRNMQAFGCQ